MDAFLNQTNMMLLPSAVLAFLFSAVNSSFVHPRGINNSATGYAVKTPPLV